MGRTFNVLSWTVAVNNSTAKVDPTAIETLQADGNAKTLLSTAPILVINNPTLIVPQTNGWSNLGTKECFSFASLNPSQAVYDVFVNCSNGVAKMSIRDDAGPYTCANTSSVLSDTSGKYQLDLQTPGLVICQDDGLSTNHLGCAVFRVEIGDHDAAHPVSFQQSPQTLPYSPYSNYTMQALSLLGKPVVRGLQITPVYGTGSVFSGSVNISVPSLLTDKLQWAVQPSNAGTLENASSQTNGALVVFAPNASGNVKITGTSALAQTSTPTSSNNNSAVIALGVTVGVLAAILIAILIAVVVKSYKKSHGFKSPY